LVVTYDAVSQRGPNHQGELIVLAALIRTQDLENGSILLGIEYEIGIIHHAAIQCIVYAICGGRDYAKVNSNTADAPEQVGVSGWGCRQDLT
jgi:hypothetical protein